MVSLHNDDDDDDDDDDNNNNNRTTVLDRASAAPTCRCVACLGGWGTEGAEIHCAFKSPNLCLYKHMDRIEAS